MALSDITNQRERDKFVAVGGDTAVRVAVAGSDGSILEDLAKDTTLKDGSVKVIAGESTPTDPINYNPSKAFTYDAGVLTKITKTFNGVSYEQTFTYDAGVLTNVSEWVRV